MPLQPVLIYCSEAEYEALAKCNKFAKDEEILDDEILLNLERKTENKYPLLIVTLPELMRAIDYRSQNLGIALVLCKSFRNEREAQQGLGRVGRNGDPYQRVQLKDVPMIDEEE